MSFCKLQQLSLLFLLLLIFPFLINCHQNENYCNYNVSVTNKEKQFINTYSKNKFSIWCSLEDGFQSLELLIRSNNEKINRRLNITIADLAGVITKNHWWYEIYIEIVYKYQWRYVTYFWDLFISVDDNPKMNFKHIDWGYINEYLEFINVTAYGPSKWRFTKPQNKICITKKDVEGNDNNSNNSILNNNNSSSYYRYIIYILFYFILIYPLVGIILLGIYL